MRGTISVPYIPIKWALYSDKVDRLGYIYGDKKLGSGLTYEEYDKRLHEEYDNFNKLFNNQGGNYLNKKYGVYEQNTKHIDKTKIEYYDIYCTILNGRKNDMQDYELIKCKMDNLMFIAIVDIPISTVDSEVESELRFWIKDSMSINVHHEIPEDKRLQMLPAKTLRIKTQGFEGELEKCRVIDFVEPFRVVLLVERIKK
jgi:hypothetical protein